MRTLGALSILLLFPILATGEDTAPFKVEKHGSGKKVVVLIPGLSCGASVWDGTIKALEGDYTLYAVTLAGFDGVPPIKAPYCDAWAAALADWIVKEKLEKPVVVGHSLGGNLALRLAIAHSELLGGIVLVDAAPIFPPLREKETIEARKAQMSIMVKGFLARNEEQWKAGIVGYLTGAVTKKEDVQRLTEMCVKGDRDTYCGSFLELATTDLRPDLPKIKVPAVLIAAVPPPGTNGPDPSVLARMAKESWSGFYAGTPRLEIVTIEDAHHFVMYDQPEKFLAALVAAFGDMK